MDSFKIEFHECSTLSDSADAESSEFSELNNQSNKNSPLIKEDSQIDEKTIDDAFLSFDERRSIYKKKEASSMYWKTPGKPFPKGCKQKYDILFKLCTIFFPSSFIYKMNDLVRLISQQELRKRTKSFKCDDNVQSSMSVMMKEDSSYLNNAVVSKSKAKLFRELTWLVMQSSNYIKGMPEVDQDQLNFKKVYLPFKENSYSVATWVNHECKLDMRTDLIIV